MHALNNFSTARTYSMSPRSLLALIGLPVSALAIVIGFRLGPQSTSSGLSLNVATEALGILITVIVIDRILEKRRHREEARSLALRALHDIDGIVWVWQGGNRPFDIPETMALLEMVQPTDPLTPATQTYLMDVGARASNTLRLDSHLLGQSPEIRTALETLVALARLRDPGGVLDPNEIARCLRAALKSLGAYAGEKTDPADRESLIQLRDSSEAGQRWRDHGAR
jgi:hypothetical protein